MDSAGLILVHATRQETHLLTGIEATVWNLLTLRYTYRQLLSLAAILLDSPEPVAENRLQVMLTAWQSAGLLVSMEQADG
jgi:hypothetical protein